MCSQEGNGTSTVPGQILGIQAGSGVVIDMIGQRIRAWEGADVSSLHCQRSPSRRPTVRSGHWSWIPNHTPRLQPAPIPALRDSGDAIGRASRSGQFWKSNTQHWTTAFLIACSHANARSNRERILPYGIGGVGGPACRECLYDEGGNETQPHVWRGGPASRMKCSCF